MEIKPKLNKKIVLVIIFWGSVLAIGGVIYGNQSPLIPNIQEYQEVVQKEKLSTQTFNCWLAHQRTDFKIIEFAKTNECSQQLKGLDSYTCYNARLLDNPKWLKKAFLNSDKQIIVNSSTPEKGFYATARLKRYGIKARMLDQTGTTALNIPVRPDPVQPSVKLDVQVKPTIQAALTKPISIATDQGKEIEG